ncbi:MAG: aminotransferase class IV family protein [Bdellovibrionaceae bacterium]|nr:aminotransferase class IV family protein [Pseudobdellovibrionaceae bacterium]
MSSKSYFSFYSTYTDQTTTDPGRMVVPIDDHGFHRGDGVFEAIKWIGKKIWLLDSHLSRLEKSAERIGLKLPCSQSETRKKIDELITLSESDRGLIRIFVTRGTGGFGVSPYECTQPQMYIVTTELKEWSSESVMKGVSIRRSEILPKQGLFAQVKSLNYLPNVLMKKEAIDSGFDFSFGVSPAGDVLESSTENLSILKNRKLITPLFDSILRGTSLIRLIEILPKESGIQWEQRNFTYQELVQADDVFLVGTTIDVLPVTRIDNHLKTDIKRVLWLRELLQKDQL